MTQRLPIQNYFHARARRAQGTRRVRLKFVRALAIARFFEPQVDTNEQVVIGDGPSSSAPPKCLSVFTGVSKKPALARKHEKKRRLVGGASVCRAAHILPAKKAVHGLHGNAFNMGLLRNL
jgi:hypothetical protein